ncbi:uncharacterized protein LOC126747932 [Anthonomus grandis grandis]|uniref:uncharacterized protein LOC126744055 n=1 Tax=Anthonomus grandis grandis TaxID=2921223 RepID=UPI0021664811|nr:uncharacterized protein LOC126744055 [Anthonomus grandis grandis]XP_050312869.1 uncharacterized protein LOC126747932 [Anthonomus grandis grandis]
MLTLKNKSRRRAVTYGIIYAYISSVQNKKNKKRACWTKKWLEERSQFGHIPLLKELRENNPNDFKNYLRMDCTTFDNLLQVLEQYLVKEDTVMRMAIPPNERLMATLRFLATGRSYEDLKFSTAISPQALGYIIPETCKIIYEQLKNEYLKFPTTKEEWNSIAKDFENKWHFINCGGALDGKHIRITSPAGSGALYYNYKHFYSIVLMALVNANYEFIYVDVGKNGRMSDAGVIEYTEFYRRLSEDALNLPDNTETTEHLNYVFVCDEAFALHRHILKPYPQKDLNFEKRIYNYRLSRARNVVENAFGLIASRFRILHTCINLNVSKAKYIILAICVLHNYLRRHSSSYITSSTLDKENSETHEIEGGDWRQQNYEITSLKQNIVRNVPLEAKQNRENYLRYFLGKGKIAWQEEMIKKGKA